MNKSEKLYKTLNEESKLCPLYKKCGGCQLQNMTYSEQLSYKQVKVIRLLGKFCHVNEIIGMENPFHYRNKVQAAFALKNGKLVSGVYQSSTGKVVHTTDCLIEDTAASEIIADVTRLAVSFKLRPFDINSRRGFLRHVLVKRGFASGQIMVVLVTAEGEFPSQTAFVNALISHRPEITTVVRSINKTNTGLLLGRQNEELFGDGYIEEQLCNMTFRISPHSFYQVNPVQTEILYKTALSFADLKADDTLIDAYCGTGTIGLIMSKHAGQVFGVEVNRDAVNDARANAKANGVKNISFYCADAGDFMCELAGSHQKIDAVVTDPPRAGCSRRFLESLARLSPKKVIYISCNPETLARDMRFLTAKGYRTRKIQPVDMFPFTNHVECVVLMSK